MQSKTDTDSKPPKPEIEPLVSADVIAALLSLTSRSVYNHFHSGLFSGYRIGKSIRFRVSEVLDAIEKSGRVE